MNFMTIKRFKNEIILLVAILFVLLAWGYKYEAKNHVSQERQKIETSIKEISQVSELKKLWGDKKIGKKLDQFKTIITKEKIKSLEKRSRKMSASYQNLTVKELNNITKQLFKTPVQITKLSIQESGKEKYTMEFTCKW